MNAATEKLPLEVGELGNFEIRMLRNLQAAVADWDEVCSALGAWEAANLTADNAGAAKEHHRHWIRELMIWGEAMERMTVHPDFPDQALAARVNARMRHLRDKAAMWHREMSPADEERILRTAFA